VDLKRTLVLRHRPTERQFRKVLPLLAGDRLDLFDAYQSYRRAGLSDDDMVGVMREILAGLRDGLPTGPRLKRQGCNRYTARAAG